MSCASGVHTPLADDSGRPDLCPVQGGDPPPLHKTRNHTVLESLPASLSCAEGMHTPLAEDSGRPDLCPVSGGGTPPLRKTGIQRTTLSVLHPHDTKCELPSDHNLGFLLCRIAGHGHLPTGHMV